MMPFYPTELARALRRDDLARAERRRLLRAIHAEVPGPYGAGMRDALGHRLIAIGTRMVSDPTDHPTGRRAA